MRFLPAHRRIVNYQLAALVPKIGIIRDALLNYDTYKEHNHPNKNRPTVLSTLLARRILRGAGGGCPGSCLPPQKVQQQESNSSVIAERGFDPRTFGLWAQHANHCATPLDVQTQMRDDSVHIVPLPACAISCCMRASGVMSARAAQCNATARGFEPLRAEPNGFLVHHLNHSVTLSL